MKKCLPLIAGFAFCGFVLNFVFAESAKKEILHFSGSEIRGEQQKPGMGFTLSRTRARFACDAFNENIQEWTDCVKKEAGIVDDAKTLSNKLASKFVEDRACPSDVSDIETIKKLAEEYDRAPFPVDIADLIAFPLDEQSPELEAHLPIACGYKKDGQWFKLQSYCKNEKKCYSQGNNSRAKNVKSLYPIAGEVNLWESRNSYRNGGFDGDGRFIPLGNGVFIETYRTPYDDVFYHGLILVPTKLSLLKKACEKEKWLKTHSEHLQKSEVEDAQTTIQTLLVQGEALEQVKSLTKHIEENKKVLPKRTLKRLRSKARDLLEVVEGKSASSDMKTGPSACAELESVTGSSATFE